MLAAVEDRRRGWRSSLRGAVILRRPAVVPTTQPLDVAWCKPEADGELQVHRIWALGRYRVAPGASFHRVVILAPAGSFERWHLRVGDRLEVK